MIFILRISFIKNFSSIFYGYKLIKYIKLHVLRFEIEISYIH